MEPLPPRADVAIVGAGTAGAAAAALCAQRGLRVVCLDRRPLTRAGARWINGVPGWIFDRVGLARPTGAELRGPGVPFHLLAGTGPHRVVITGHGLLEVDMALLVARLQELARQRGALILGDTPVEAVADGVLQTPRGVLRADWIVDASGLGGARLLDQPPVAAHHICAAAQETRRCVDPAGARAYFERHATPLGRTLCFTGIAGPFSIINLKSDGEVIELLTGTIPAEGHPSGRELLHSFAAEHPWIGERMAGGAGAIPLRRPYDRLASDRIALIGDAGCQVFPAHGSGIGPELLAAHGLADALATGGGPRSYAVSWQRTWGGLLAAFDVARRLSQTLPAEALARLMTRGLMDPELTRAGLAQHLPRPTLATLPAKLRGAAREPALAVRLGAAATRMAVAGALYARYPTDPAALPRWSRRIARVFGDAPDPVPSS